MPENVVDTATDTEDEIIRIGQEAVRTWNELRHDRRALTFATWLAIGHAREAGRRQASFISCNRRDGGRYNRVYGEWLNRQGLRIKTSTSTWLTKCLANETAILAWLQTRPDRDQLNYPEIVFKNWSDATQGTHYLVHISDAEVRLRQQVADLQRRLDEALDNAGQYDGPSITHRSSAPDTIRVLSEFWSRNKTETIARGLLRWLHDTTPAPARPARTPRPARPTPATPAPSTTRAQLLVEWSRTISRELARLGPSARGARLTELDPDVRQAVLAAVSVAGQEQWEDEWIAAEGAAQVGPVAGTGFRRGN